MEDFESKTKQLASLVTSLQQKGEDNSDLHGIIAQLEAAVAKRAVITAETLTGVVEVEAKIEPIEPIEQPVPASSVGPPSEDTTKNSWHQTVVDEPRKRRTSARRQTRQTGKRKAASQPSKSKRKSRKRLKESSESGESLDDEQTEDSPISPDNFGVVDKTIGSLINPWTGALEDEYEPPADSQASGSGKASSGNMSFRGACKLCEVDSRLRDKSEDQVYATESSLLENNKFPVYTNLVSFAAHLKSEHVVFGDAELHSTPEEEVPDEIRHGINLASCEMAVSNNPDTAAAETPANSAVGGGTKCPVKHDPDQPQGDMGLATAGTNQSAGDAASASAGPNASRHRGNKDANPKPQAMFLVCPHCQKKYNLHGTAKSCYDQLVFHMHRKHGEALPIHVALYSCTECSFQTLRRRDLTRHNYVVHTDHESRGVPCEVCGKCVLPTSMVFHMAAVHGAENVPEQVKARTARAPCNICGKEFRGEINLQRHIKCVHSKIKDQLCHLCSQSFFAKRELQLHMFANHKINMSNMKVFKCPAEGCNYETLARRHLFIHSSVHTETKNFTCEHCGKAFKSKPALTQHLRIMHTNDVEYKCPKCAFTSHAKQYVQRHMVVHSDVKKHKCNFEGCEYATHFIENLTKHKRKHKSKE